MKKLFIGLLALGSVSAFADSIKCGSVGTVGTNSIEGRYADIQQKQADGVSGSVLNLKADEYAVVLAAKQSNLKICVGENDNGSRTIYIP